MLLNKSDLVFIVWLLQNTLSCYSGVKSGFSKKNSGYRSDQLHDNEAPFTPDEIVTYNS